MKVIDVSLLEFGVSDPQAGGSSRPICKRPEARGKTERRPRPGRMRARQVPVRVRHSRSADCATVAR